MNVRKADANDIILISVGVMVGSTIIRNVHNRASQNVKQKGKEPNSWGQTIVLGFFLTVALMILAIPFPTFTKGLALLGVVGAFAVNGPTVYAMLGGK